MRQLAMRRLQSRGRERRAAAHRLLSFIPFCSCHNPSPSQRDGTSPHSGQAFPYPLGKPLQKSPHGHTHPQMGLINNLHLFVCLYVCLFLGLVFHVIHTGLELCIAKGDTEFVILLPPSPKCWNHKHASPHLLYEVLGMKPGALCRLLQHFTNLALSPVPPLTLYNLSGL